MKTAFEIIGISDWSPFIVIDQKLIRPAEVDFLRGDPTKANHVLGWKPKTVFVDIVRKMVLHDIQILTK